VIEPYYPKPPKKRRDKRSSTARGYGAQHPPMRKRLAAQVAAGRACCVTCGETLRPDARDLGHDPADRNRYIGPQCWSCKGRPTVASRQGCGNRLRVAVTHSSRGRGVNTSRR